MSITSLVDCLKQAGADLDDLWLQAVSRGSVDSVLFAEASQDVHRALIALLSAA